MGLDGLELILRVEDAFGINIPNEEASRIVTIGDMYQSILPKLRGNYSAQCLTARAFYRLRQALIGEGVATRSAVRPQTPLDQAVPPRTRRRLWPVLTRRLELKLPALRRPSWLTLGILVAVGLWMALGLPAVERWAALPSLWVYGIGVAALCLAFMATRPFATTPRGCTTVGDLARTMARDNFAAISRDLATVNEKEVWESLVGIISDDLGVRQTDLKAETRFVQDLNIG